MCGGILFFSFTWVQNACLCQWNVAQKRVHHVAWLCDCEACAFWEWRGTFCMMASMSLNERTNEWTKDRTVNVVCFWFLRVFGRAFWHISGNGVGTRTTDPLFPRHRHCHINIDNNMKCSVQSQHDNIILLRCEQANSSCLVGTLDIKWFSSWNVYSFPCCCWWWWFGKIVHEWMHRR